MSAARALEALRVAAEAARNAPARWRPGVYGDLRAWLVLGVVEGYSADDEQGTLALHLPATASAAEREAVEAALIARGLEPAGTVPPAASGGGWTLRFRRLCDRT